METKSYIVGVAHEGAVTAVQLVLEESGRMYDSENNHYMVVPPQVSNTIEILDTSRAEAIVAGVGFDLTQSIDMNAAQRSEIRLIALDINRPVLLGTVGKISGPAIGAVLIKLQSVEGIPGEGPQYKPVIVGYIDMIDGRENTYSQ